MEAPAAASATIDTVTTAADAPVTAPVTKPPKGPRKKPNRNLPKPAHPGAVPAEGAASTAGNNKKGQQPKTDAASDRAFLARKHAILTGLERPSLCDKSPKGSVDVLCLPLMDVLNNHEDYITTSSCSGRVSLFHMWIPNATTTGAPAAEADIAAPVAAAAHSTTATSTSTEATPCSGCDAPAPPATTSTDDGKGDATASVPLDAGAIYNKESAPAHGGGTKRGSWGASGWLVNSHFPIADPAVAVLSALREFCTERSIAAPHLFDAASTASSSPTPATAAASSEQQQGNDQVTLLMEPFVMHVQCRTMRAAHTLFAAAVQAGFRNSGIATGGAIPERAGPNALPPKLTVAIRHTAGVQVPLVTHGRCYATADYVRAMAEHCNELLTANNTERIDRLTNEVRRRLTGGVAVAPAAAAAAL